MHTWILGRESLSGNMLPICAYISSSRTAFCCVKASLLHSNYFITELILWCWQMQNEACFFILRTFVSDPKYCSILWFCTLFYLIFYFLVSMRSVLSQIPVKLNFFLLSTLLVCENCCFEKWVTQSRVWKIKAMAKLQNW